MKQATCGSRTLHESPALIGCALATRRDLNVELRGLDAQMRFWGVEDFDLGLKSWSLERSILHAPEAVIVHRFRSSFGNYEVPAANILASQIRVTFKNFTKSVWEQWVRYRHLRNSNALASHPEELWAHVWRLFDADLASACPAPNLSLTANWTSRQLCEELWLPSDVAREELS